MSKFKIFFISVGIFLLFQSLTVRAGWFKADFSADLVHGTTQGQNMQGKMYVGAGRVRTEMNQNAQRLIEIIDPGKGLAWVLNEVDSSYKERRVPKLNSQGAVNSTPCDAIEATACRKMPDEIINGRSASKWLLKVNGKERIQWNDTHRDFPIQIVESGQIIMAMIFLAEETLNGRRVERWRAIQHGSGKSVIESEQWYDPQLNIAIRQVAQDGSFRELRNIQLGEQADELFNLPQGYHRSEAVVR